MSQTLLISRSDIIEYRSLSANANTAKKLDPFIVEAQNVDLKGLIGNAFLYALIQDYIASPSLSTYSDLFNGSTWVCGTKTLSHNGLKSVLCLFAYARYVVDSNTESTAYGTVEKKNEFSDRSDGKRLTALSESAYSSALSYWNDVKDFLNDNSADYPLWCVSDSGIKQRISGVDNINSSKDGIKRHNSKNRYI